MNAVDRFMQYVTWETTSDPDSETYPSTAGQLAFAAFLVDELKGIGITDAFCKDGCVYGHIPPTQGYENEPKIGLIAHMDTSPDVSGAGIVPEIVVYDGHNIGLLEDRYLGQRMIVSGEDRLLGADDKAGIAEIVAACDRILHDPSLAHGPLCIAFTPDEEIGNGTDRFDLDAFGADFAYTVDGGELGEIEYENFNGADVRLTVHGVNTHPGSAKGKMRNALLYLHEFIAQLPPDEIPERTEGREGFFHVTDIAGNVTCATMEMLVRDHDRSSFEARKALLKQTADLLNRRYGEGTFVLSVQDRYYNMVEIIRQHMHTVERVERAMQQAGVTPHILPIRGGTDGARLSFMGLPCPNISAGGINFHSKDETIPVDSLLKMTEVLLYMVTV